ncbi:hypothetical protein AC13_5715 [Escherichia coli 2-011-08_S3_C2]|nr:hypothetical protein AC13_5715 [Escherichia coli 2-011-08_S3_C2]
MGKNKLSYYLDIKNNVNIISYPTYQELKLTSIHYKCTFSLPAFII